MISTLRIAPRVPTGLALALSCSPSNPNLICGPGTHRDGHVCLPSEDAEDSAQIDTSVPPDTGEAPEPEPEPEIWDIYLLAGQSNMEGLGQVSALPPSLRVGQDDVWMYWSGEPEWRGLQPSSGYSSGWGEVFGPEVMFGRTLADADSNSHIALIKHSVGGTDLAQYWYPGESSADISSMGEGYQVFLETILEGLSELEDAGQPYRIAGMIWMQGESDASNQTYATQYRDNLEHFIDRVREDVSTADMPVAIGLIDCLGLCAWRTIVRDAQTATAETSESIHLVETQDLGTYPQDGWHYQGIGMRVLGTRFAEALLGREISDLPVAAIKLTGTYSYGYTGYYTLGWSFDVHEPIQVTDLGIFDLGEEGLSYSSNIGIWKAQSSSLLYFESIPSELQQRSTFIDGFRMVGTDPFLLETGSYIIGNTTTNGDPNDYIYDAGYQSSDELTWTTGMHSEGSTLAMPTIPTSGSDTIGLWFGPNFRYYPEN